MQSQVYWLQSPHVSALRKFSMHNQAMAPTTSLFIASRVLQRHPQARIMMFTLPMHFWSQFRYLALSNVRKGQLIWSLSGRHYGKWNWFYYHPALLQRTNWRIYLLVCLGTHLGMCWLSVTLRGHCPFLAILKINRSLSIFEFRVLFRRFQAKFVSRSLGCSA